MFLQPKEVRLHGQPIICMYIWVYVHYKLILDYLLSDLWQNVFKKLDDH